MMNATGPPSSMIDVPPAGLDLLLGGQVFGPDRPVVMAVINRTSDSFYAPTRYGGDVEAALAAVDRAVADGADLVDIGGVRAGRGHPVSAAQEIDRVVPFLIAARERYPGALFSVDTWRSEVAEEAARAGAVLINDTWAGHDPQIVDVAARHGIGVVISHTGGLPPRTDPFRVGYPEGVVADVVGHLTASARRAVAAGIEPRSVLIDPTHDFGKNTWHSLALVRATSTLARIGYPVLMAVSRKDFIGETLDLPVGERLEGTLAAMAVAAWCGAKAFRVHDVPSARRALDMVAAVRGDRPPKRALRGLV